MFLLNFNNLQSQLTLWVYDCHQYAKVQEVHKPGTFAGLLCLLSKLEEVPPLGQLSSLTLWSILAGLALIPRLKRYSVIRRYRDEGKLLKMSSIVRSRVWSSMSVKSCVAEIPNSCKRLSVVLTLIPRICATAGTEKPLSSKNSSCSFENRILVVHGLR